MQNSVNKEQLFCEYYQQWIEVYKRGAIREATMAKYLMTHKWVEKLAPRLKVSELTRTVRHSDNATAANFFAFI